MKIYILLLPVFVNAASIFQYPKPTWDNLKAYRNDMTDRTLKITDNLYKRIIVEYSEYQTELLRIDNAAVKVAFEYYDKDGNGVVTKEEMLLMTEKDPEKRNLKTDTIASQESLHVDVSTENIAIDRSRSFKQPKINCKPIQEYVLIYLSRYWDFVDGDRNGSLDFLEFRKYWTDMIDIKTQRFFDIYDVDYNDIIEGIEMDQLAINSK